MGGTSVCDTSAVGLDFLQENQSVLNEEAKVDYLG